MREVYLIVLTGFGVFGLYCFIDTLMSFFALAKFPPSITILKKSQDEAAFSKIKHIENNVPNNYTVFYPFETEKSEEEQMKILMGYIKNVLNVNKK